MILFEDRSIKYAETFGIQFWIIILVICYSKRWYGFALVYTNLSHEFLLSLGVDEAFDKKRNHDMRGIKETYKLKLWDAQGTQDNISRSLKHLSLGIPR